MKKVLILGSDFGALDLVRAAKRMGVYAIVSDNMISSPAKLEADEAVSISTQDVARLEDFIKTQGINGVTAGASELNLESCRRICKDLSLPLYCASDEAWGAARNKRIFKDACLKYGVPVAKDFYLSDDLSEEELGCVTYPVVVKPVDLSGNRGMSYCDNERQLIDAYRKARKLSKNSSIVVERKLRGPEFTAYYLIESGEASLSYYTSAHHQSGQLANLYSLECTTMRHLGQYLDEVDPYLRETFKNIGCTDGVAWIESIYDEDGHFYVLEMGYRLAGPSIYAAHEKITGFDTYRWQIECAIGVEHSQNLPKEPPISSRCAASYNLFTSHSAKIAKIVGMDDIESLPNVMLDLPKREGGEVREHANMGVIRIYGENSDEICNTVSYINDRFHILDGEGENIFIRYSDFDAVNEEYLAGLREFDLC